MSYPNKTLEQKIVLLISNISEEKRLKLTINEKNPENVLGINIIEDVRTKRPNMDKLQLFKRVIKEVYSQLEEDQEQLLSYEYVVTYEQKEHRLTTKECLLV